MTELLYGKTADEWDRLRGRARQRLEERAIRHPTPEHGGRWTYDVCRCGRRKQAKSKRCIECHRRGGDD